MLNTATADALKTLRLSLRISQSNLARRSGVPRWKINSFELGVSVLNVTEQEKLSSELQRELARLQGLHVTATIAPPPEEGAAAA